MQQPWTTLAALERIQAQLNELRATIYTQWPTLQDDNTEREPDRTQRATFAQDDPRTRP